MISEAGRAKRMGKVGLLCLALTFFLAIAPAIFGQNRSAKPTTWEYGLTAEFYNRGIKWADQTSSLKSLNLVLDLRAKNLANFLNLNLFAGLGNTSLNGTYFDYLPVSLDYQGGQISGIIFGAKAGTDFFSTSDFIFGATVDFASYLSFNKTFPMENLVVPGQIKAEPNWSQVTAGLMITYDGFENIQPFLEVGASFLWGQFKMTETIEDLEGQQTIDLKNSTFISIILGWNINLTNKISLVPRIRFFPGSKAAVGGGLSFVYGF
ncbi:MAG: hypothetical protein ACPLRA_04795 [Candidatus Saccharicenans sp.]